MTQYIQKCQFFAVFCIDIVECMRHVMNHVEMIVLVGVAGTYVRDVADKYE